jgi:hypothetical protein
MVGAAGASSKGPVSTVSPSSPSKKQITDRLVMGNIGLAQAATVRSRNLFEVEASKPAPGFPDGEVADFIDKKLQSKEVKHSSVQHGQKPPSFSSAQADAKKIRWPTVA